MNTFAVIGLGNFGGTLAVELADMGKDVLAVDADAERAEQLRDLLAHVVIADARDRDTLRAIGVGDVECVVISLGRDLEASVLCTLHCVELGVGQVYAKVTSNTHARVLERVGATRTIFPEREMAARVAHKLVAPNLVDFLPLGDGYSVEQIRTPPSLAGLTLEQAQLPNRFRVQVIALRDQDDPRRPIRIPRGTTVLEGDEQLIVLGKNEDLAALQELD